MIVMGGFCYGGAVDVEVHKTCFIQLGTFYFIYIVHMLRYVHLPPASVVVATPCGWESI